MRSLASRPARPIPVRVRRLLAAAVAVALLISMTPGVAEGQDNGNGNGDDNGGCSYGYTTEMSVYFGNEADSGVPNYEVEDDCTIMDEITAQGPFGSHDEFVSVVDDVTAGLEDNEVITDSERDDIIAAAEASDIGRTFGTGEADQPLPMDNIGLVLFTTRDQMSEDPAGTLNDLAECGFQVAEPSGSVDSFYGLDAAGLAELTDDAGINVPSIGISLDDLRNDLDGVIANAEEFGAEYVRFSGSRDWEMDDYATVAAELNEIGADLAEAGITVAYHNHEYEFEMSEDGVTGYDVLVRGTDPDLVTFELDTYWAEVVGHHVVDLIQEYPGRFELLHLKDLQYQVDSTPTFADVGDGVIDFPEIFAHADMGNVQWSFVEHDQPTPDGVTSACNSLDNLSEMTYSDESHDGVDPDAPDESNFVETEIVGEDDLDDPFEIDILPDGRVMYVQRIGQIKLYDPDTDEITTIGDLELGFNPDDPDEGLPVERHSDGLIGMSLDPDFADTGWVYLHWSDPDVFEIHVSRFAFDFEESMLDMDSEQRLLSYETERYVGVANAHMAGGLAFGPDGLLYIATGDNAEFSESDNFTPIDEREGMEYNDAQRSSGNTNDLRGSVLRILPTDDGDYDIPEGNLFPPETSDPDLTRPEIYAMGLRNPFRINVDPITNNLLIGDYGPDAGEADPERGPEGLVELNIVSEAANLGWPYCHGPFPYVDYDFETGESGEPFDCDNLINDSPNNTGLEELPPAADPDIWYGYGPSVEFPEFEVGGGAPHAGPVYEYDAELDSDTKFPEFYDGKWFVYEYSRGWIRTVDYDEDGVNNIEPFRDEERYHGPFDMEFGPDGSLYLLDFGSDQGVGRGDENANAGIYRIDYVGDDDPGEPDEITATLDPADPDGNEGWYVSDVTLTLEADDDDAEIQLRASADDEWETYTEPVTFSDDGVYDVEYRFADDDNGDDNGDDNVTFQVDQTPPATGADVDEGEESSTLTLAAEDATSGVDQTTYAVDGGEAVAYDEPVEFDEPGEYTVNFSSVDVAGNEEESQDVTIIVDDDDGPVEPPVDVCARHQGGETFPDSPGSGHRFFIDCLAELGVVQGYDDGTFGPRDDVSREQLATYVVNALEVAGQELEVGGDVFPDVSPTSTHGEAVYKLQNAGIVQGYEDGTFRPQESVSRDQTARYVVNALESVLDEPLASSGVRFPDVTLTQYQLDIDKLATAEVIQGFEDGTYGPREPVTRAQMARFVANGLEVLAAEGAYDGP